MADWSDRARAAGASDGDIAALGADLASLADADAQAQWTVWADALDDAAWPEQLVLLRTGWPPSSRSAVEQTPRAAAPDSLPEAAAGSVAPAAGQDDREALGALTDEGRGNAAAFRVTQDPPG